MKRLKNRIRKLINKIRRKQELEYFRFNMTVIDNGSVHSKKVYSYGEKDDASND